MKILSILFFSLSLATVRGATITAATGNQSDVQNAINSANPGDTVIIPAGSWNWTSAVSISKQITLQGVSTAAPASPGQGPGTSSTKIFRDSSWPTSQYDALLQISPSSDVPITVQGIWFDQGLGSSGTDPYNYRTSIQINGSYPGNKPYRQIRVTNCTFYTGTDVIRWVDNGGGAYGVVDHCYFYNPGVAILLWGGNYDLGDSNWARGDYQAGSLNFPFAEDCIFVMNTGYYGQPWVEYHWAGGRSVLRHCTIDATAAPSSITGPIDCHGNQNYWHVPGSNNQRGTIRFEFYNNTVKLGPGSYQIMDLRGGSHFIHDNTITSTDGSSPPIGTFRDEESEGDNTPGIPVRSPVQWPCEDQISASFIWNNTMNGVSDNYMGTAESSDAFYVQQGRDYWLSAPNSSTTTSYPSPGNPTISQYPSPYASLQTISYTPAVYPHPLVSGAAPAARPSLTLTPTPTPALTPTPTPGATPGPVIAVQSAFTDQATSTSSISATFSNPNLIGDCIVVSVGWANAPGVTISSVSDTHGNTYNLGIGPTSTMNRAMYYATNIGARSAGNVVTVTFSSASGGAQLSIGEFSGVSSAGSVLDGGAGRQITSATPDSGAITTTSNGDLLVCAFWGDAATPTSGTGFTQLVTEPWDAGMEYQVAGSAGSYDGTWNLSSSVQSEVQMIALTAANPTSTPPPGPGPITGIQSAFTDQGTSSGSISATFSGPNTAGDCIVISVGWANAPGVMISSVTDSQGNTYNLGIGPTSTVNRAMYYALNIGGHAAGNVVQVTFTSAGGAAHLRIGEFSGVSSAGSVLDGGAGRQITSATPDSGAITTTSNGDLLVCAFWGDAATPTSGTGFTQLVTEPWDAGMEYQVAGSAGSYDGTWNLSSSVQSEVQMIALTAANPTSTPPPGPGPITGIQSAFTDQGTSSGSISATFSGPNTAGDCIVISVGWANAPGVMISSVTDSQGNTYNLGIGPTSTVNRAMYYALNIGGHAAGNVVQVTFTSAGGAAHLRIGEFSGVSSAGSVFDGGAGRQITSATPDSGAITTTSNGDLLVCAFWGDAATPTAGTGFTQLVTEPWDAGMEYQVAGSAGSYDGTWNLSSSVQSEVQMIALTAANPTSTPTQNATQTPSGNTINALTGNLADVQSAINAANYGDTVVIPSGTFFWSGSLSIAKSIVLKGAGISSTYVNRNTFGNDYIGLISISPSADWRATLQPGWKWSTCVKPIVNTKSCEASHLQYHVSGRIRVRMDYGSEDEFGPGEVSLLPPGHDAWVVADEPVVVIGISGMAEYAKRA